MINTIYQSKTTIILRLLLISSLSQLVACQTLDNFGWNGNNNSSPTQRTYRSQPFFPRSPQSMQNADTNLVAAVNEAFVSSELSTSPIRVSAHAGTVVLSGYVKTIRESDVASAIASQVAGVGRVQNYLIVKK